MTYWLLTAAAVVLWLGLLGWMIRGGPAAPRDRVDGWERRNRRELRRDRRPW